MSQGKEKSIRIAESRQTPVGHNRPQSKAKSSTPHTRKASNVEVDKTGDHLAPKPPTSAWTYFNNDKVKQYAAEGRRKEAYELSKEAWQAAKDKVKEPYHKMADKDKQRYDKQVAELKRKGYYTLEDGTKSTDKENSNLLKSKTKSTPKKSTAGKKDNENRTAVKKEANEKTKAQDKKKQSASKKKDTKADTKKTESKSAKKQADAGQTLNIASYGK